MKQADYIGQIIAKLSKVSRVPEIPSDWGQANLHGTTITWKNSNNLMLQKQLIKRMAWYRFQIERKDSVVEEHWMYSIS